MEDEEDTFDDVLYYFEPIPDYHAEDREWERIGEGSYRKNVPAQSMICVY